MKYLSIRSLGLLAFFVAFLLPIHSQVVNIENKRFYNDSNALTGSFKFKLIGLKNQNEILDFGNTLNIQYKKGLNKWLFIGDINYLSTDTIVTDNNGYVHFRYNRKLNEFAVYEAYTQAQYNQLLKIDIRVLAGTGFRFTILHIDDNYLFYGLSTFYEHERDYKDKIYQNNLRLSTYFACHFQLTNTVMLANTVYFQPRYGQLNDHRIFNELLFGIEMSKRFQFETSFYYLYDSHHPKDVPGIIWRYENKLTFSF